MPSIGSPFEYVHDISTRNKKGRSCWTRDRRIKHTRYRAVNTENTHSSDYRGGVTLQGTKLKQSRENMDISDSSSELRAKPHEEGTYKILCLSINNHQPETMRVRPMISTTRGEESMPEDIRQTRDPRTGKL